ncbi:MAG TPA: SMC-Scp complex subunit ScpB [Candidatus Paceibacterota bacterium]|nr:SMC-Scp complex subunit ScpB [Candidatus Paceibacterota bacterium]
MPIHPNTTQLLPDAPLDARIEALLFATGSAISRAALARQLGCDTATLDAALEALVARLAGTGLALIETERAVSLATAPAVADTLASMRRSQFDGDLGQAGLEVLAIILYRQPATRAAIDYIRGVNSAATIRALTMRGLIERAAGKGSDDSATYRVTPAALAHLGVMHESDIPEYAAVRAELDAFEARAERATDGEPESDAPEGEDGKTGAGEDATMPGSHAADPADTAA